MDLSALGKGQMAGFCKCGNETSGSIKYEEFLDNLKSLSSSARPLLIEVT
jgi:hypothetical protein